MEAIAGRPLGSKTTWLVSAGLAAAVALILAGVTVASTGPASSVSTSESAVAAPGTVPAVWAGPGVVVTSRVTASDWVIVSDATSFAMPAIQERPRSGVQAGFPGECPPGYMLNLPNWPKGPWVCQAIIYPVWEVITPGMTTP